MEKIKEIFEICLKKGLFFTLYPHVKAISVHDEGSNLNLTTYYDGNLVGFNDEYIVTVKDLLKIVKEY